MQSSTAIIIGGGVIGLSTAYHLARKGFGKIILLDKGSVGDGASSRAAGIITDLLWTDTGVLARKLSLELYAELSEELAPIGYRFQNVGCLNLFDVDSWQERKPLLSIYDRLDVPYQIMTASEMNDQWTDLAIPDSQIGLYDPLGGYSEPHEYIPALTSRVRDFGVNIREEHLVSGFVEQNGQIAGVKVRSEGKERVLQADVVISTVHVWTLQLLETIGMFLPVKAFVHQRYVSTELAAPVDLPAINANPQDGYIRPARLGQGDHRILAGFESADRAEHRVDSPDFNMASLTSPTSYLGQMTANLAPILPSLQAIEWATQKVGLISFAIDGEPVLGPIKTLPGLYVGASFHSGGFAYNPAAGQLLAEFAMDGEPSIDVSTFSPHRFESQLDTAATKAYLEKTIPQSEAVQRRH